ncbi:unnamed protein product [Amoebophrya sp. A120]|nr:unnamed protein product [Amoebophrya sp. A120]|eukprot:GSA120T00009436001.1
MSSIMTKPTKKRGSTKAAVFPCWFYFCFRFVTFLQGLPTLIFAVDRQQFSNAATRRVKVAADHDQRPRPEAGGGTTTPPADVENGATKLPPSSAAAAGVGGPPGVVPGNIKGETLDKKNAEEQKPAAKDNPTQIVFDERLDESGLKDINGEDEDVDELKPSDASAERKIGREQEDLVDNLVKVNYPVYQLELHATYNLWKRAQELKPDLFSYIVASLNPITEVGGLREDEEKVWWLRYIVMAAFYMLILSFAANMMSDGAELLMLVPEYVDLVGSIVLPLLGAFPDALFVLFSGLGPSELVYRRVTAGFGFLAGSSCFLLCIPLAGVMAAGRVPVRNNPNNPKQLLADYTTEGKEKGKTSRVWDSGASLNRSVFNALLWTFLTSFTTGFGIFAAYDSKDQMVGMAEKWTNITESSDEWRMVALQEYVADLKGDSTPFSQQKPFVRTYWWWEDENAYWRSYSTIAKHQKFWLQMGSGVCLALCVMYCVANLRVAHKKNQARQAGENETVSTAGGAAGHHGHGPQPKQLQLRHGDTSMKHQPLFSFTNESHHQDMVAIRSSLRRSSMIDNNELTFQAAMEGLVRKKTLSPQEKQRYFRETLRPFFERRAQRIPNHPLSILNEREFLKLLEQVVSGGGGNANDNSSGSFAPASAGAAASSTTTISIEEEELLLGRFKTIAASEASLAPVHNPGVTLEEFADIMLWFVAYKAEVAEKKALFLKKRGGSSLTRDDLLASGVHFPSASFPSTADGGKSSVDRKMVDRALLVGSSGDVETNAAIDGFVAFPGTLPAGATPPRAEGEAALPVISEGEAAPAIAEGEDITGGRMNRFPVIPINEGMSLHSSVHSAMPSEYPSHAMGAGGKESDDEVPEDLRHLPYALQQRALKQRAAWMILVGVVSITIFAEGATEMIVYTGDLLRVPTFAVAFFLGPLATNAGEFFAAVQIGKLKTEVSTSVSVCSLLGAAVFNNTLVLAVLYFLCWRQGLMFCFLSQTCCLLVCTWGVSLLLLVFSVNGAVREDGDNIAEAPTTSKVDADRSASSTTANTTGTTRRSPRAQLPASENKSPAASPDTPARDLQLSARAFYDPASMKEGHSAKLEAAEKEKKDLWWQEHVIIKTPAAYTIFCIFLLSFCTYLVCHRYVFPWEAVWSKGYNFFPNSKKLKEMLKKEEKGMKRFQEDESGRNDARRRQRSGAAANADLMGAHDPAGAFLEGQENLLRPLPAEQDTTNIFSFFEQAQTMLKSVFSSNGELDLQLPDEWQDKKPLDAVEVSTGTDSKFPAHGDQLEATRVLSASPSFASSSSRGIMGGHEGTRTSMTYFDQMQHNLIAEPLLYLFLALVALTVMALPVAIYYWKSGPKVEVCVTAKNFRIDESSNDTGSVTNTTSGSSSSMSTTSPRSAPSRDMTAGLETKKETKSSGDANYAGKKLASSVGSLAT